MTDFLKGSIIATAVAGLFGCASGQKAPTEMPAAAGGSVHCAGVNECSGQGACGGADHSCKGQNGCKGKGWVEMTEAECLAKGGTVAK